MCVKEMKMKANTRVGDIMSKIIIETYRVSLRAKEREIEQRKGSKRIDKNKRGKEGKNRQAKNREYKK